MTIELEARVRVDLCCRKSLCQCRDGSRMKFPMRKKKFFFVDKKVKSNFFILFFF